MKVKYSYKKAGIILSLGFLGLMGASLPLAFPDSYKSGVRYETITRGGIIEDMYIAKEAISALQSTGKLPQGTLITMEEWQNDNGKRGKINRYIIMQKSGDSWEFQAFRADKSLNSSEDTKRCYNCHRNAISGEDIVFSLDRLKSWRNL